MGHQRNPTNVDAVFSNIEMPCRWELYPLLYSFDPHVHGLRCVSSLGNDKEVENFDIYYRNLARVVISYV
jgi:hypothetical protein